MSGFIRSAIVAVVVALAGCSNHRGVKAHLDDHYPEKLSEWQLFTGAQRELKPNAGVIPYDVNTALFSNNASKLRTVWMPAGAGGIYRTEGVIELPVGAILSKTFSFGERHIETRLYIHKANGWQGVTYVWNHDQDDAVLDVTPAPTRVKFGGEEFDYDIPNVNQCKTCHEGPNDNGPLGITARNLNRDGQLQQWVKAGYLDRAPADAPRPQSTLEARARDYLDVNCASCHVVGGRATKSSLFLSLNESNGRNLGICKPAEKFEKDLDILPGNPNASVLVHRMQSLDPKLMMPDIGHTVVDKQGLALIREWIAKMPGTCPAT